MVAIDLQGQKTRGGDAISLTPDPARCHLSDEVGTTIRNIQLRGAA